MSTDLSARIDPHFASRTDPRRGKVTYPLINILTIALCATIAGADDFGAIADWARQKRDWLGQFLDLSKGIPSHDRFDAVFRMLKPEPFERCLVSWITSLHEVTAGQLVAIDGKALRQSCDKASAKSALHMVGAWAVASRISLGQVAVAEKSNEITAIPKLLELLELAAISHHPVSEPFAGPSGPFVFPADRPAGLQCPSRTPFLPPGPCRAPGPPSIEAPADDSGRTPIAGPRHRVLLPAAVVNASPVQHLIITGRDRDRFA
jgi:DDE family transposase